MKLVIHCGFHKTGSTSFQKLCSRNRSLLREFGIHYPNYGNKNQHSFVLWEVQKHGLDALADFLTKSFAEARCDCHTVLLSGEDFENCIADVGLASEIEALAYKSGYTSIVWVVVTRPIADYVASLYAEKSKHGVVLSQHLLQKAAEERGCLYLSTINYNYIFIFQLALFEKRFKEYITGHIVEYDFKTFTHNYPGVNLLRELLPHDAFTLLWQTISIPEWQNKRLHFKQVEANYVATALNLRKLRRRRFRWLVTPFVSLRLRKV